jgi:hypothetical protein
MCDDELLEVKISLHIYFLENYPLLSQGVRRALAEKLYLFDPQLEGVLLGYERARPGSLLQEQPDLDAAPRAIISLKERVLQSS